ncbi:MAG: hypothetical protein KAS17_07580 [Victivallaceae bacterium]|nr:hypothetical protein [Victivallaceae bacterium]
MTIRKFSCCPGTKTGPGSFYLNLKTVRLGTPRKDVVKRLNSKLGGWAQYYKVTKSVKV